MSFWEDTDPPALMMLVSIYSSNDWDKIIFHIRSHPVEAKAVDSNGYTALHHVLKRRDAASVPFKIYQLLINVYPEAAGLTTKTGQTPLALACWRRVPLEVLSILAEAHPMAARIPDNKGVYPLVALWQSYVNSFGGNDDYMHVIFSTCSEERKRMYWDTFDLLLHVTYHGDTAKNNDDDVNGDNKYRTVHSAAGIPWCPSALMRLAIRHHTHQLREMDNRGRLPLSIAAAANFSSFNSFKAKGSIEKSLSNKRTPSDKMNKFNNKDRNLHILTQAYPRAACLPDNDGRLALHLALENGNVVWEKSVRELALAAPEAMQSRDATTLLYPYQMAAIYGDTTTAFGLLLACPHELRGVS